jgi:hypothetical protein
VPGSLSFFALRGIRGAIVAPERSQSVCATHARRNGCSQAHNMRRTCAVTAAAALLERGEFSGRTRPNDRAAARSRVEKRGGPHSIGPGQVRQLLPLVVRWQHASAGQAESESRTRARCVGGCGCAERLTSPSSGPPLAERTPNGAVGGQDPSGPDGWAQDVRQRASNACRLAAAIHGPRANRDGTHRALITGDGT